MSDLASTLESRAPDGVSANALGPAAPAGTLTTRKLATASSIGTTLEWYDFTVYNTLAALVFNQLFFPSFDPLTGR